MIFYDPTESRERTRLPQSVILSGVPLEGLEAVTGADLLLSPLSTPNLEQVNEGNALQMAKLGKHLKGGLLIQRKSGLDLVTSIPRLAEIILRMLRYSMNPPWLLFVGRLDATPYRYALVDDQMVSIHGSEGEAVSYKAVNRALTKWRLRGGGISIVVRDTLVAEWVNDMLELLQEIQAEPTKPIIRNDAMQVLTAPTWRDTLTTLPLIGEGKARLVGDHYGSLAKSLLGLTDLATLKRPDRPKGIGQRIIQENRLYLGLNDGENLAIVNREERRKGESE